jgi:hypothetical protein
VRGNETGAPGNERREPRRSLRVPIRISSSTAALLPSAAALVSRADSSLLQHRGPRADDRGPRAECRGARSPRRLNTPLLRGTLAEKLIARAEHRGTRAECTKHPHLNSRSSCPDTRSSCPVPPDARPVHPLVTAALFAAGRLPRHSPRLARGKLPRPRYASPVTKHRCDHSLRGLCERERTRDAAAFWRKRSSPLRR